MRRIASLTLLATLSLMALPQATEQLVEMALADEVDAYEVYATELKLSEHKVSVWRISSQTKAFPLCSRPVHDLEQDAVFGPLISDYAVKNLRPARLIARFKGTNYVLVGPEEDTGRYYSVVVFSSVGFDPSHTRAAVCFAIGSSGRCDLMIKREGRWEIDRNWRGENCGWAASIRPLRPLSAV